MLEFNASALLLPVISVCLSKYLKRKVAVSSTVYFQVQNVPMCYVYFHAVDGMSFNTSPSHYNESCVV